MGCNITSIFYEFIYWVNTSWTHSMISFCVLPSPLPQNLSPSGSCGFHRCIFFLVFIKIFKKKIYTEKNHPRYLYQIVFQKYSGARKEQYPLFDLCKVFDQIESSYKSDFFFTEETQACATCSDLPSDISTMSPPPNANNRLFRLRLQNVLERFSGDYVSKALTSPRKSRL